MPIGPVVIVGSGLAGYTVARELRKIDRETPLVVVSRDDAGFYSKPMLSTALAAGKAAAQLAGASAQQMAEQLAARVLAHTEIGSINPSGRVLQAGDETLRYSKLVLALGADPIAAPLEGDAAGEVMQVNDLAGYARFRAAIEGGKRVALLGAGLIGCEFANDLAAAGYEVEVVDPAQRPLGRLLPEAAGERLRAALEALGVRFHLGLTARAVHRAGKALSIELSDGTRIAADAVLSAIGLRPRTALAASAGLKVDRGIVVDRFLATSAPDVYALGDCAEVEGHVLPYVLPIMQAARALAKTLAGTPTAVSYPAMPVVVKTPALPAVVCPPPAVPGGWQVEASDAGIEARFEDAGGSLQGFALLGAATAKRNALAKELPALLA
jgi:rubredoxin-NAD+ reductase